MTEINLIPEDKLEEVYNFIHYFRVGVEASQSTPEQIMQFATCVSQFHPKLAPWKHNFAASLEWNL